jgi:hypothetical protein
MASQALASLPDHVLLRDLNALVAQERVTTAALLAHLAEVDARRLYAPAGYPSMFAWCVGELRFSEDMAFNRIRGARTARRFPQIFAALAAGRLSLGSVLLLAPYLTEDMADELISAATHKSKAQIELLLAQRFPKPDVITQVLAVAPAGPACQLAPGRVGMTSPELVPAQVGLLAASHAPTHAAPPAPHTRLAPLSPERFALQVTIDQATHDKLRYAQALLGHAVPSGDMAAVLDRALDALILQLERQKFAKCARARPGARRRADDSRYIPAGIRRAVWQRDGGRCTFVSEQGHRCEARSRLEFDHIDPFARGGHTTTAGLRLRCRAHNQYAAERVFGAGFMQRKRDDARERAARVRQVMQARTAAPAREMAMVSDDKNVIAWLRQLGFRADEARRAAASCEELGDAPLEARVRHALRHLAPRNARREPPVATSTA